MHLRAQEPLQQHIPFRNEEEDVFNLRMTGKLDQSLRPKLIDLFSGAGGMTLGFSNFMGHAFHLEWANDYNDFAVKTYNSNFGEHCLPGDIADILRNPSVTIPEAEVVIGGPPCQGFSLLNKQREGDSPERAMAAFHGGCGEVRGLHLCYGERAPTHRLIRARQNRGVRSATWFQSGIGQIMRCRLRSTPDEMARIHYRL